MRFTTSFLATAAMSLMLTSIAQAQAVDKAAVEAKVGPLIASTLEPLVKDPAIVAAIKAQNEKNAALTAAQITELDNKWRAEVAAAAKPTIDEVAKNPSSAILAAFKAKNAGLVAEVFAMDNKGLNVGMSDTTSDYWQGDEPKWQESFGKGPGAKHISDVELDDSSQTYSVQVSLPVLDEAGKAIGAVTFGLDAEKVVQ